MAADKEKISMIVDRMKGPGGLPISAQRASKLKTWLSTLSRKGLLLPDIYREESLAKDAFATIISNPGTRSTYTNAIMSYVAALDDEEFVSSFPGISRRSLVDTLRSLITEANLENVSTKSKRKVTDPNAPNAP